MSGSSERRGPAGDSAIASDGNSSGLVGYSVVRDGGPGSPFVATANHHALTYQAETAYAALGGLLEVEALTTTGILDDEPVDWLAAETAAVCPVHLTFAPCREHHFLNNGEPHYTVLPQVIQMAVDNQARHDTERVLD